MIKIKDNNHIDASDDDILDDPVHSMNDSFSPNNASGGGMTSP